MSPSQSLKLPVSLLFLPLLFVSVLHADNSFPPANVFPQQAPVPMRPMPNTAPSVNLPRRAPIAMPTQPRQMQNYRIPAAPYAQRHSYSRPYARTAPLSRAMPRYPSRQRQLPNIRNRMPAYRNNTNAYNNFPTPNNMMPFVF